MINLLENPDIWLIAGVILITVEVFFGSLVLFLPIGLASMIVGLIYKFQNNFEVSIIDNWAYALVLWGIISIIFSYLIQKFFKNKGNKKDINSY
jgi:membrane protein implicated in regulation of membrane protease activity